MVIKYKYLPSMSIGDVKRIAEEYFPECKIKLRTPAIGSPFVFIRKGFFVGANVNIVQKESKGQTIICINDAADPGAIFLFFIYLGILFHYVFRGDFLNQVKEAMVNGIKEKYNVGTIK